MGRWTDLLLPPFLTGWGRKAADAPAMGGGMNGAAFVGPQAADYPSARGFASMLRFGFAQNPYLFRATMYTANACAGIPWLLYDTRSTDRKEIAKHPLLSLVNAKANTREGAARLWIRTHSLLLLSGDVYLIALTNGGDMPVSELYAVRSDRMKPILTQSGELQEWEYSVGAKKQYYPPEVVRYLTEFSPEDENTGLAPAKVAARSIDQHNSANDWNTALLQNMARPSGMLTPQGNVIIPEQAHETLKNDLLERYSGPRNAGKPLVPRAPMDWKEMGTKPSDMDWLKGKTIAAREIAIAMAVPPELLGDSANKTYSNFGEARRSFYTETVLPRMDVLKAELNAWLLPLCGLDSERFALDYDTDDIEALQEDRQSIYDRAYKGWTAGLLTLDQALKMIGESEVGGDMGEARIIPSSYVTLEDAIAPPEPPPPQLLPPAPVPGADDDTTDAGDNPPTPPKPNNQKPPAAKPPAPQKRSRTRSHKALRLDTEEQKAAHWNKTEKTREQWYSTIAAQVKAQLRSEHSAVMGAIADASSAKAMQTAAERAVKQQHANWTALLSAVHISVGEVFAKQTAADLEDDAKALNGRARRERKALDTIALVDSWQAHVIHWMLTGGAQKVTSITDTTRSRIQNEIAQGLAAEETIDQLAKRLDSLYLASIIPNRSETIARTEVIGASNEASMFGARATGLALDKEWIATRDGRTREDHADADGQRVKLDENFSVGGVEMDSPGNSGDPAQDINCRCTQGYHVLSSADDSDSTDTSDDEG